MKESLVFISYVRSDREFVDRLNADLRANGVDTWQDTSEILPGQNWMKAIEESLRRASVILYVSSARTSASEWMALEARAVVQRGTQVIPVIVDDAGAEGLPRFLREYQWVDFRESYDDALNALLRALGKYRDILPVAPAPTRTKGYVFLSYAEEDSSFIDDLKAFLAQKGYAYWDYRESDRDYHNDLYLELESVITEAAAMLSCVSPDWKRSRMAVKEYHFSVEARIPAFLLRLRDPGPTLVIAGMPYIDFSVNQQSGFARLDKELSRKGL